jgi:hypothetical protein
MLFRFLSSEVFFLVATVVAVSASLSDVIIRSALQNAAVDCQSCLGLLTSLKPIAQLGDDALITQLTGICIQLGVIIFVFSMSELALTPPRPRLRTSVQAS